MKLKFFERLFLHEFVLNGLHGARAYRTLRPHVTTGSARVGAHRILRRIRVLNELHDKFNVSYRLLTQIRGYHGY